MKRRNPLILILLTAVLLGSLQLSVRAVATRVTIAVTCDQAPYQFIGESGEPEGMLIELLEAAAREKGTELHYMICDSTSKCFEALRSGKADVVLTDTSRNSTLAEETVHLDLVSSSLCVLAGNSVAQAIDAGASIKRYSAVMSLRDKQISAHYLGTNSMVGENLTRVCRDQTETAEVFFSGGADIAILERAEANDMLKRYQNAEEYTIISNYVAPITYAAFLRPHDDALYRNLETGLTGLYSSGRYGEIAEKWTSEQEKTWISAEMQRRIIAVGGLLAAAGLAYIFMNLWVHAKLRRAVASRTEELRMVNGELANRLDQLREEGTLRGQIIEHSPSAMALLDGGGRVTFLNSNGYRMAGRSPQEALGIPVQDVNGFREVYEEVSRKLPAAGAQTTCQGELTVNGEASGRQVYRYVAYQVGMEQTELLLSVEDITEEERRRQAVFEAEKNKTLNALIAGISHEIKNPLMSLYNYAVLIPRQAGNPAYMESFANVVPGEVERIRRLVDALSHYARPAQGKKEWIRVEDTVQDCVCLTEVTARKKGARMETRLEPGLRLFLDKDRFKQSVLNLLVNSMEAAALKRAGEPEADLVIRVSTFASEGWICVQVYDNGCGMSEEERQNCTRPFYTTKPMGTGVGLAMCRQFAEENGGSLQVESEKNHFTQVTLKLGGRDAR